MNADELRIAADLCDDNHFPEAAPRFGVGLFHAPGGRLRSVGHLSGSGDSGRHVPLAK